MLDQFSIFGGERCRGNSGRLAESSVRQAIVRASDRTDQRCNRAQSSRSFRARAR